MWLRWLRFSATRQITPASGFSQNANDINDSSTIRAEPANSLDLVALV
jgi:hypothetical protein